PPPISSLFPYTTLFRSRLDDAVHVRGDVGATTHLDGLHRVHQLVHEALVLGHRTHGDDQGGCGALLTRVAEGGLVNILHRQIRVRLRGDDVVVLYGCQCV